MLHYTTLPKHKSERKLKKYNHSKLRMNNAFQGRKVYTYIIGNHIFFTAKPKQKETKVYYYTCALWLIRYYNGIMDKR